MNQSLVLSSAVLTRTLHFSLKKAFAFFSKTNHTETLIFRFLIKYTKVSSAVSLCAINAVSQFMSTSSILLDMTTHFSAIHQLTDEIPLSNLSVKCNVYTPFPFSTDLIALLELNPVTSLGITCSDFFEKHIFPDLKEVRFVKSIPDFFSNTELFACKFDHLKSLSIHSIELSSNTSILTIPKCFSSISSLSISEIFLSHPVPRLSIDLSNVLNLESLFVFDCPCTITLLGVLNLKKLTRVNFTGKIEFDGFHDESSLQSIKIDCTFNDILNQILPKASCDTSLSVISKFSPEFSAMFSTKKLVNLSMYGSDFDLDTNLFPFLEVFNMTAHDSTVIFSNQSNRLSRANVTVDFVTKLVVKSICHVSSLSLYVSNAEHLDLLLPNFPYLSNLAVKHCFKEVAELDLSSITFHYLTALNLDIFQFSFVNLPACPKLSVLTLHNIKDFSFVNFTSKFPFVVSLELISCTIINSSPKNNYMITFLTLTDCHVDVSTFLPSLCSLQGFNFDDTRRVLQNSALFLSSTIKYLKYKGLFSNIRRTLELNTTLEVVSGWLYVPYSSAEQLAECSAWIHEYHVNRPHMHVGLALARLRKRL
ncbi:hypothetical protein RCL1_001486 [Eukaryota sp. TZLM3-RCL]